MNNFLIYRSSAGSGKTYTLVKEYLKLVLNDPVSFKNVLAVTFTNKSAAEMKQRIISALKVLSDGKDDKLKQILLTEGVKGDIKISAALVLQNILHKYSYFSVSTIDSFFHRVIRSFARELKLQLGYNIELDQHAVLDKITDKLLDDAGSDDELTGFLEDFIYYSIDDEKGWKIDLKIKDLAEEIFSERYILKAGNASDRNVSKGKLKEFIGVLFAIKNDFEGKMKDISLKSLEITEMYSLVIDDFPHKKAGYINFLLNKINKGDFDPKQRARDAAADIRKMYNKSSAPAVKAAAEAGLHDQLKTAVNLYDTDFIKYNTAVILIKTIYVTGIFKDLKEKLKQYRDDNNVLLISDINSLLLNVISGEGTPFVYEKIGSYYKNFLIDEFQDTSTIQWQNFFPLIENAISEGNGSMIVGDVKQSIYRWRNGNMKLLLEDVKNSLSGFTEQVNEKYLGTNYRSKKIIVEFNNAFFEKAVELCTEKTEENYKGLLKKVYNDSRQKPADNTEDGYINIRYFTGDKDNDITSAEFALADMINNIKKQLALGYRQKDILVLVRKNPEALQAAHALIDSKLRVVSNESLMLTNSPKVRLLVNVFRFISDPGNEIAKAEILFNYLVYLKQTDTDLNLIFTDKQNSNNLFNHYMPPEFWDKEKLNTNINLSAKSIYALTEELIGLFGLGELPDAYLLRFLDVIKKYSDENNSDVYGFVSWWDEHQAENTIIVPEEEDAVRVMTIHKAKGLQAPIVYIPFANWEFKINNSSYMWVSSGKTPFNYSPAYYVNATSALKNTYFAEDYIEEEALTYLDNLNLLYVAFTRAEDKLFIGIPRKGTNTFNAGKLILDTLNSSEELSAKFDGQINNYEDGEADYVPKKFNNSTVNLSYQLKKLISGKIADKIIVKPEYENYEPEKLAAVKKQKNRGVILHKALSFMKDFSELEIDNAVKMLILLGLISSDQNIEWKKEISDILKSEDVKKWFNPVNKVMNERDILLQNGKIYRPDKVVIYDNTTVIIDFKSGIKLKEHEDQIKFYGSILSDMGFKNIELYLYYITENKIINVKNN